ncbi:hypothetical protein [uncultured Roseivirga sp.]|uniref:hypothetical protein n=1 Tax=uncultured Roseivirga sp. TaxID=543088 RepID=UPI0030DD1864|tara:strand:+ start:440 stop:637 length:198 start_codon:yes stop_codon:yes gene_type:complete
MNLEAQKTGNMKSSLSEEKLSRHEKILKKGGNFSCKRELEPMAQVELTNQNLIFKTINLKAVLIF